MKKERNNRVEQEIREILDRADFEDEPPAQSRRYQPARRKLRIGERTRSFPKVPPGIAWLAGIFGFAILAILVSDWSRTVALLFAIASILVLFSPLVIWSRRSPSAIDPGVKEWRGRVIQMPPRQEGPLGKIRYKLWELRNRSRR